VGCLFDTDVVSEIFVGLNPLVAHKAQVCLLQFGQVTLSLMTRYEVLRGLKAKNATAKLAAFDAWCQLQDILPLSEEVVLRAADVYADLKLRWLLIGDNDLFLATPALHHGLPLATRNVKHFSQVPGLTVEDWTQP
jgi:tRNA(fMet)-specific endonuclease VapC